MTQFLISHSFGSLCVTFENPSVPLLNQHIYKSLGITVDEQRLTCNGRELCDESQLQGDLVLINLNLRLVGGKGGFGSLLRSQKSTKKTTNFGACRTVDGQRLRDVQQQQRVAEAQQNQEAYERNKLNEKRQKQQVTREEEQAAKLIAQEQKLRKEEQTHKEIVSDLKDSVREGKLPFFLFSRFVLCSSSVSFLFLSVFLFFLIQKRYFVSSTTKANSEKTNQS